MHDIEHGSLYSTILVGKVFLRIVKGEEVDTLFLSMLNLFEACWHFGFRTTINQCDLSTKTLGCAARVHGSVSTTNNDNLFAKVHRSVGERIGSIHEVYTSEVFVRRHDVDGIFARDIHEVWQACARTNEDALEAFSLELVDSNGFAHDAVGSEVNTHLLEVFNLYVDNLVRQTELRNTIFQYATNFVESLEDMNIVALLCHVASEAQARRTRTNYCHLDAIGRCQLRQ